jgi:hypothetical protein
MDQVARRRRILGREVLMAAVAGAERPLILVLVATEAGRHLRPDHVRMLLGDGLVAAHAVSVGRDLVSAMLEAQVLPRESCSFSRIGRSVAAEASARVMRPGVAPHARRRGREVEGLHVPRGGDALVAVDAVDPVGRVSAMFERVRRVARPEAEHARTRRERERSNDQQRQR